MPTHPAGSFGLEVTPQGFIIDAHGSCGYTRLSGTKEAGVETIVLDDRNWGEKIVIDKSAGTISLQSLERR